MAKGYYRTIIKELKNHGAHFVRNGKGDHEIWFCPITGLNVTVDRSVVSRHTANGILKQAGIDKKV